MDELIIGEKRYVSSKRAAEITGYAKDYVGQLCREGRVEATLVGRSWYVLEESIQQHRFGEVRRIEVPAARPVEAAPEYAAAHYSADQAPMLPQVEAKPVVDEPVIAAADTADLQSAWREWFERRPEPLLETPEVIDAREEVVEQTADVEKEEAESEEPLTEVEEMSPVGRYEAPEEETAPEEERIPIHRFHEVYRPAQERVQIVEREVEEPKRRKTPRTRGGDHTLAIAALLWSVAGLCVAVTIIGSGYLDRFITQRGFQFEALRSLGGTILIDKSK